MKKLVFVLEITDPQKYQRYRALIKPLMDELRIAVLNEYRISDVVHSRHESDHVNRLAMFGFPDEKTKLDFFGSATYQRAKTLFDASTRNLSILVD